MPAKDMPFISGNEHYTKYNFLNKKKACQSFESKPFMILVTALGFKPKTF